MRCRNIGTWAALVICWILVIAIPLMFFKATAIVGFYCFLIGMCLAICFALAALAKMTIELIRDIG